MSSSLTTKSTLAAEVDADTQVQVASAGSNGESTSDEADKENSKNDKQLYSGKVVFVQEALAQRGITAFEELKGQVALETDDGKLLPIIPDWRGRAFFQDERLRNRRVDVIGTQRDGLAYLQALVVYFVDEEGNREYMDYWCDICSIPMYEIKPCDCCQGDIRLRLQPRELPDYLTQKNIRTEADGSVSRSESSD